MSVEILQTLSFWSYIAAGVMLAIAITLFFLLDIPKLYGEVSGRTAKRVIKEIQHQNEFSGSGAFASRSTDKSKRKTHTDGLPISPNLSVVEKTMITETEKTTILPTNSSETTVLGTTASETTVLTGKLPEIKNNNETTVLSGETVAVADFKIDVEIGFSENCEIIE